MLLHPIRLTVLLHPLCLTALPHPIRLTVLPHPIRLTVLPHPIRLTVLPHPRCLTVLPHPRCLTRASSHHICIEHPHAVSHRKIITGCSGSGVQHEFRRYRQNSQGRKVPKRVRLKQDRAGCVHKADGTWCPRKDGSWYKKHKELGGSKSSNKSHSCSSFSDCTSCTSHSTWMPGSNCRWCPKGNSKNCHAEGSIFGATTLICRTVPSA